MVIHNEPVASLSCHVGPNPLQENAQAEARRGEELEVHGGPGQPSQKAAYFDFRALQHRKTLADYGHGALVKVAEGTRRRIANDAAVNQLSCITPLLHCHLCNARKGFAVLIEGCRIAHDENLGMCWHCEIFLNANPPCTIHLDVQPLSRGRRRHPSSPDHGFACNALTTDHDSVAVDLIDTMSETDSHAYLPESILPGFGETFGKRPQNTGSHIDEHNSG